LGIRKEASTVKDVEFLAPSTLQEALDLLADCGERAKVVAGGTDAVVELHRHAEAPEYLLYLGKIPGLSYVREDSGGLKIGALTTITDLAESPLVQRKCSVLAQAAGKIGGPAIRNVATVGGNLAKASPAADSAVALSALDAELKLASQRGERIIPLSEFAIGPGKTALAKDELLIEINVPPRAEGSSGCFLKFGQREAMFIAMVNTAVDLSLDGEVCQEARIALGAVAPTVIRARKTEDLLRGKRLDQTTILAAAEMVAGEISPIGDGRATAWYRSELSQILVRRAISAALSLRVSA
jgi:xanthine dehydrogenase FAD-binding subunit